MTREELLKETKFVVEATGFEVLCLWTEFSEEAQFKTDLNVYKWEQINPGYIIEVGRIIDYPVNISCSWNRINDVLIMFWEASSRIVDLNMIDVWLRSNCAPKWDDGTRLAYTNAMNFHDVIGYIKDETRR